VGSDAALLIEAFRLPSARRSRWTRCAWLPGAGPRGDQHALPFRSYPRKFFLWRRGCADLGARESGVAHDGVLSQVASRRPRHVPGAWEQRVREAKTDSQREHAKSDVEGMTGMFTPVAQAVLALPSHPLDPANLR